MKTLSRTRMMTLILPVVGAAATICSSASGQSLCELTTPTMGTDTQQYDYFGSDVDLSGDVAVIGAYDAAGSDYTGGDSGAAYVFRRVGNHWAQEAKLVPDEGSENAGFGDAVAVRGSLIGVGAYGDDQQADGAGAVYVFRFDGQEWQRETKLTATDGAEYDYFGVTVALDHDRIIVGATQDDDRGANSGSVYVFRYDGLNWLQEAKLTAGDGVTFDYFGGAAAIAGETLLVGAESADANGISSGAVYEFSYQDGTWEQIGKQIPDDGQPYDSFGTSLAMFGDTVLVGASGFAGQKTQGTVYCYRLEASTWTLQQKLFPSEEFGANTRFGDAVALDGDRAVVGDHEATNASSYSGAAYLYRFDGVSWIESQRLVDADPESSDSFGSSVALSGDTVLIGASGDNPACRITGAAYFVIDRDCNANALLDACESELVPGTPDCNANAIPDECDLAEGSSSDCDSNDVPDECEADCNFNSVADACDITAGTSLDCQPNSIPDECEGDCNRNQKPDDCDEAGGTASDADGDSILDECESPGCAADVNDDGTVDPLDAGFVLSRLGCDLEGDDATCSNADVNGDGAVDPLDAGFVQGRLGACPFSGHLFPHSILPVRSNSHRVASADLNNDGELDLVTSYGSVLLNTGEGQFGKEQFNNTGVNPTDVALGYLDGDVYPDMAAVSQTTNLVTVLFNNGDGSFAWIAELAVGDRPTAPTITDLDRDWDGDILVLDSNSISVLINSGQGEFRPQVVYEIGGFLEDLAAADFDNDGDTDAALANNGDNTIVILLNQGDGVFTDTLTLNTVGYPSLVATADLDLDGDNDLVIAAALDDAVVAFMNDGHGGFIEVSSRTVGDDTSSLATSDLNGDGWPDVVAAGYEDLSVVFNAGDGAFGTVAKYSLVADDLALADLDGDGTVDLALAEGESDGIQILMNDGEGGFQGSESYFTGEWSGAVSLADVNGDGRLDLAVTNQGSNDVSLFLNTGAGELALDQILPVGINPWPLDFGDIDGDGDHDLVVGGIYESPGFAVFMNPGDGWFDAMNTFETNSEFYDLKLADVSGDGRIDLVATSGYVQVYLGNGDGTFADATDSESAYGYSFGLADMDGDDDLDVVLPLDQDECDDGVAILVNNGFGFFDSIIHSSSSVQQPFDLAVGDLDGDGDSDVVLVTHDADETPSEKLSILLNDGAGGLVELANYDAGDYPSDLAIGDFDLDGDADVLVLDFNEDYGNTLNLLAVYRNYGDGRLAPPLHYPCGPAALWMDMGDLEGDGDLDVAIVNLTTDDDDTGAVTLMFNQSIHASAQIVGCTGRETAEQMITDCNGNLVADVCDMAGAGFFPEFIIENTTGLGDYFFVGPPDGLSDGIGDGGVIYDLGEQPMYDGFGLDFTVYEEKTGGYDPQFDQIDVLVSADGNYFVSIKDSEDAVVRLPGDEAHEDDDFARSYDLLGSGVIPARFVEVKTVGTGLWAGFKLDAVAILHGAFSTDCNANSIPDECEAADDVTVDCDGNGVPDGCEGDCNGNGISDPCDLVSQTSFDCNANRIPDECDLSSGVALDCNLNQRPDSCDISDELVTDCDRNGVPDDCEMASGDAPDCNANGVHDSCDLNDGSSMDCNETNVPDECDIATGASPDCDGNQIPDECDLSQGAAADCNANEAPDSCDIVVGVSVDCNVNNVPDECEQDCNGNGIWDECDATGGPSSDCNANHIPDECEAECNGNGIPDDCDLAVGVSSDCNSNLVPDECDLASILSVDCNGNGFPDECDLSVGSSLDCNSNAWPDECDSGGNFTLASGELTPIGAGSPQSFVVAHGPMAAGDVTLDFTAQADLANDVEWIEVEINGVWVGSIFVEPGHDCPVVVDEDQLIVDGAVYNASMPADGPAIITMTATEYVSADNCGDPHIAVTVTYPTAFDCNGNQVPDSCDLVEGVSLDDDHDGIPDECAVAAACLADVNLDGAADPLDVGIVLARLGCAVDSGGDSLCIASDLNDDGVVDPLDAGFVASRFGACE